MFRASLLILAIIINVAASHTVTISLNSKWRSTPILAEASEYFSGESNSAFWAFIDHYREKSDFVSTDATIYEAILDIANKLLTPQKINLLKWSLSLRVHSSTVTMFERIPREFNLASASKCASFAFVEGTSTCTKEEIAELLKKAADSTPAMIFPFDHVNPTCGGSSSDDNSLPAVILYADLGSKDFYDWHDFILSLCKSKVVGFPFRYAFRQFRPATVKGQPIRLSGYGVELVIKNTEYKAKDDTAINVDDTAGEHGVADQEEVQGFLFGKLKSVYPHLTNKLDRFKQYLRDTESSEMHQLKAWEFQDLSVLAAGAVAQAKEADQLRVLTEVSSNFPTQLRWLLRESVNSNLVKELTRNQKIFSDSYGLSAGENSLYINGIQFDIDSSDIFHILSTLNAEAALMDGLHAILSDQDLISHFVKMDLADSSKQKYSLDLRHADDAIFWANDIEKDRQYASWPQSVSDLLQPTFPGMLRYVRKNLFNVVIFADPADAESWQLLKLAEAMYVHNTPVRIGLVLHPNQSVPESTPLMENPSKLLVRSFHAVAADLDSSSANALGFLTDLYEAVKEDGVALTPDVILEHIRQVSGDAAADRVLDENDEKLNKRQKAVSDLWRRSGFTSLPVVTVNGYPISADSLAESAEDAILTEVLRGTPDLQRAVYHRELDDNMNVFDYIFTRPSVVPRLSSRFLGGAKSYVDFVSKSATGASGDDVEKIDDAGLTKKMMGSVKYFTKKDDKLPKSVSIWLVADPETKNGRSAIRAAFSQAANSADSRLGVVLTTSSSTPSFSTKVMLSILGKDVVTSAAAKPISQILGKLLREDDIAAYEAGKKNLPSVEIPGIDVEALYKKLKSMKSVENDSLLKLHAAFASRVLKLASGEQTVVINGKVFSSLNNQDGETFEKDDFYLAERMTKMLVAERIVYKLQGSFGNSNPARVSDYAMMVDCVLSERASRTASGTLFSGSSKRRTDVTIPEAKYAGLNLKPRNAGESAFDVIAIVDPATREAGKLTKFIEVMYSATNSWVRVYFNCKQKLSELPVKSFYRYVIDDQLQFSEKGAVNQGSLAHFGVLPQNPLLTTQVHPPESWLVESVSSPYDLDNICLNEFGTNVNAVYELEHLLVEGHCFDQKSGQPPRGLQFTLGTPHQPIMYDTIVMANLGYFQLKANPGIWLLALREGRSSDLYTIKSQQFADSPSTQQQYETVIVAVNSFKSKIIKITVAKKPGMEKEELLEGGDAGDKDEANGQDLLGNMWSQISKTFGGEDKSEDSRKKAEEAARRVATTTEDKDYLNIFSVVTGHLYERLMRIMMVSVMKHNNKNTKVKFWLLKNYLSPTFKHFIPHLAKHYGFEYELVQYKWPRWLISQTDKQRIIWGYKILFLDVLFPLNVSKIIFVDADQVVRTDMTELRDLNLDGAPYGYTPFCSSRKEMDGFRFWKSGYWKNHLAGKPYHISALYVVDLRRFRKLAAGDRLRGQYQALAQDPNSLSNLDQDLPNNMIHQVAIKSLPQEWLYCDTWCAPETMEKAKTIDLCNNPLTKEPKLSAARRLIPEWETYDSEIRELWNSLYGEDGHLAASMTDDMGKTATTKKSDGSGDNDDTEQQHSASHDGEL